MGPLGHSATFNLLKRSCNCTTMPWVAMESPSWCCLMGPDIAKISHGWDVGHGVGDIDRRIETAVQNIGLWRSGTGTQDDLLNHVAWLCHFCADAMTVGQSNAELWGIRDDLIDWAGELVPSKAKNGIIDIQFQGIEDGLALLIKTMTNTKEMFFNKSWVRRGVPMPWQVADHQRRAVSLGAGFARAFIRLEFELA